MLHPTGSTEVTFRLERTNEGGIDAARKRLLERLERQTWRSDLDESRRRLAEEKTLAGMFAIVEGKPK